ADAIVEHLDPQGVIVVVEAEHLCMTMRGVRKPGASTITSAVRGQLRESASRAEAMSLILGRRVPVTDRPAMREQTKIMGVLNVTPDSFSDGGRYFDHDRAIAHGLELIDTGADIIDVGGESTRPGSVRVDEDEELRRVVPVIRELAAAGAVISVDTMRARVARESLAAGAHIINDVSAGQSDPTMLDLAAESAAPIVLMHWRGYLDQASATFHYDDVVAEVITELRTR